MQKIIFGKVPWSIGQDIPLSRGRDGFNSRRDRMKITIVKNGPYMVDGPAEMEVNGEKKELKDGEKGWLCRCGHSSNKPFCDGTHAKVKFNDEE